MKPVDMVLSWRSAADEASGYGFELTFRLKREPGETAPPTWPAVLMQALARYVFQSGRPIHCHIWWFQHEVPGTLGYALSRLN